MLPFAQGRHVQLRTFCARSVGARRGTDNQEAPGTERPSGARFGEAQAVEARVQLRDLLRGKARREQPRGGLEQKVPRAHDRWEGKPVENLVALQVGEADEEKALQLGRILDRRAAVDVIPNLLCDGRYQRVLVEPLEVLSAAKGAVREAASRASLASDGSSALPRACSHCARCPGCGTRACTMSRYNQRGRARRVNTSPVTQERDATRAHAPGTGRRERVTGELHA